MWQTLTGSIVDVNRTNGVEERLKAEFVCDSSLMTVDATMTEFIGPGERPAEIHWRAQGRGWIVLLAGTHVEAGEDDHDFFDLPKLLWPQRYPDLSVVSDGIAQSVALDQPAMRLLGNGRAHLVTATVDRERGLIRSYRSEAADGTTLRSVELTYTAE
ncbi:MAG TPA: hypothetical protein VMB79_07365 [Jatrophihabitans sp.]|nr:hypothetical protein [Jatrophihabitans sp.]